MKIAVKGEERELKKVRVRENKADTVYTILCDERVMKVYFLSKRKNKI